MIKDIGNRMYSVANYHCKRCFHDRRRKHKDRVLLHKSVRHFYKMWLEEEINDYENNIFNDSKVGDNIL